MFDNTAIQVDEEVLSTGRDMKGYLKVEGGHPLQDEICAEQGARGFGFVPYSHWPSEDSCNPPETLTTAATGAPCCILGNTTNQTNALTGEVYDCCM